MSAKGFEHKEPGALHHDSDLQVRRSVWEAQR